jgi:hypothetical protein
MCTEEQHKILGFCSCLEFGRAIPSQALLIQQYLPIIKSCIKRGPETGRTRYLKPTDVCVLMDFVSRQSKRLRLVCDNEDLAEAGAAAGEASESKRPARRRE